MPRQPTAGLPMWVQSVRFTETMIYVALSDGREIGPPLPFRASGPGKAHAPTRDGRGF